MFMYNTYIYIYIIHLYYSIIHCDFTHGVFGGIFEFATAGPGPVAGPGFFWVGATF